MIRYAIIIAPRAKKEIDGLDSATKERVANALESLALHPYAGKSLKAELKGLYSYRVGDYRIIYAIINNKLLIQVVKVMHRRQAYR
ncbi:MAG: type II toxin-antitoxin system RelE/ParE family toxin [Candidatus Omnitrophota bacterium]